MHTILTTVHEVRPRSEEHLSFTTVSRAKKQIMTLQNEWKSSLCVVF